MLHPLRGALPGILGHLPPVLALGAGQQPAQGGAHPVAHVASAEVRGESVLHGREFVVSGPGQHPVDRRGHR